MVNMKGIITKGTRIIITRSKILEPEERRQVRRSSSGRSIFAAFRARGSFVRRYSMTLWSILLNEIGALYC
jgi:hypothetical protein